MSDERSQYWDERYSERGYLWGVDPNTFLVEVVSGSPPGTALDLGCGQGRNAVWLALEGHDVTALDLSPVAIQQAERLALEAGVEVDFAAADLTQWDPTGRTWDLVVLSYLQLPEEQRRGVHATAIDALAPGGRLVVIAHHLENLEHGVGGPPRPDVLFTEDQLRADFASLDIHVCEKVIRHVETEEISGDAIDVLLVAGKP
jgi:SAM-dependent methyltransferase